MNKFIFCLILLIFLLTGLNSAFAVEILSLPVEGDFKQTVKYVDVIGNRALSFKDPGWHSLSELSLNMYKQFEDGWTSSAQMQLRKTVDKEIDPNHNGLRLLSWLIETRNETFDIQMGNIYSNFTDLTLSRSLEGISNEATFDRVTLNTVFSRVSRRNTTITDPKYVRYVLGQRGTYQLIKDGKWLNDLKMGVNFVNNIDDRGSITEMEQNATALRNYVWTLDQEWRFFNNLTFNTEFGRSHAKDENCVSLAGKRVGTAVKVKSEYSIEPFRGSFQFHRIDPNFVTDSGSASTDQEMYQYGFSFLPASRFATDIGYMKYHDNLDKIRDVESTNTNNPSIGFRIQPIKDRTNFRIEPRYDWRKQKSTLETTDNNTHTATINAYDKFGECSINGGYNYRKFADRAGDSDNIVNTINSGVSRTFTEEKHEISYTPSLNYSCSFERYFLPIDRIDYINDVSFGLNFNVGQKFSGNCNYGLNVTQRQTENANTVNHSGSFDLNYKIAELTSLKTYCKINDSWRKGGSFFYREIESGLSLDHRF